MNSPSFSVYSKIGCPFCTKIMSLLEMSEIYYTEYKLGRDFTKEEFYSKFGTGSTFPRVMVGDQLIGGCSEAVKYLKENKLV